MAVKYFKNDEEALLRLAEGDLKAYRFLFDKYFPGLCNFLVIYLHEKNLSEDIAIEVFAFIWEKRKELKIKSSFKSFLFVSAKYKAISQYRKEHQRIFTSLDIEESLLPDEGGPQTIIEGIQLHAIIDEAVQNLPQRSRQVYTMAWEEDMSYHEIAIQLGLSIKTVENHIGIALKKLRESLKPYYKDIFLLWLLFQLGGMGR